MGREQGGQPPVRCLFLKKAQDSVKVVLVVAAVYGDAVSLLGLLI